LEGNKGMKGTENGPKNYFNVKNREGRKEGED
jgi:hypothetical protein